MAKKAAVNKVPKPVLHQCATLGSLMGYGGKNGEWSIDEKIKKIRDAGFAGFVGRTAFVSPEQVAQSGLLFAWARPPVALASKTTRPSRSLSAPSISASPISTRPPATIAPTNN